MRKTSLEAYQKLKESGTLSKRRWQAYDTLFHHGPLTGNELARYSGVPGMWKRLSELKKLGLVAMVGEKVCDVTGEKALTWDLTSECDHIFETLDDGTQICFECDELRPRPRATKAPR